MGVFLQGLMLGFAYVAPIGMQNMYVIQSAIRLPRFKALQVALATIVFDILLAFACFFGVGVLLEQSPILQLLIVGIGSVIVLYIGVSLIRSTPQVKDEVELSESMLRILWTCFAVTWLNPQAIIDGSFFIGSMNATLADNEGLIFILGVAVASFLWFTTLSTVVSTFKAWMNTKVLKIINVVCGVIILGFALKLMLQLVDLMALL